MIHPTNRFERKLIDAKKKEKRQQRTKAGKRHSEDNEPDGEFVDDVDSLR